MSSKNALSLSNYMYICKLPILLCVLLIPLSVCANQNSETADDEKVNWTNDFYQHEVQDIKEKTVFLKRYRGKVSLVVNVASECGYTDEHYRSLVKLQEDLVLTDRFNVLAFPCNQFGNQEPKTNKEIEQFVKRKYQLNFPMFSKIDVIGSNVPEPWKVLIAESGTAPTWNFWKYLVDGNGHVVKSWGPDVKVKHIRHDILNAIEDVIPEGFAYREHDDHEEL